VEARHEDDRVIEDSIEQPIWEPMNEGSACLPNYHGVGGRPLQNQLCGRGDVGEKLFPEALPLLLVPGVGAIDIVRSRRPIDASPGARPGSGDNFVPREPSWTFSLQLVKPAVQLPSLRARQGQSFWILRQALPKTVDELKLFVTAQVCDIESGCFPHGGSIPYPLETAACHGRGEVWVLTFSWHRYEVRMRCSGRIVCQAG
jgi:hypothetical protein